MKTINRPVAALAALLLSGGAVFGTAMAASAEDVVPPADPAVVETVPEVVPDETPAEEPEVVVETERPAESLAVVTPESTVVETDTTPYVLAAWVVADLNDIWSVPQTFKTSVDLESGNLNALDEQLTQCGVDYQIDLYYDDETTTSLLAGGHLDGPNNPAEHLAYDAVKGNPWKFIDNPDCVTTNEVCETFTDGGTSTNLNANGWVDFDTRPAGHAEYVDGGLHVYTDTDAAGSPDPRKVSWAHALNIPLSQVGQFSLDYTNTGSFPYGPGINIFVNFGADGSGTLVYEDVYGQDLWLTNGSSATVKANAPVNGGGNGSEWHGTIDQWLTVYPDAQITGFAFALGSGVNAEGTLHSLNVGCATYSFDKVDIPVSLQFSVEGPQAQCGIAGELPNLGEIPAGVTRSVSGPDGGPGVYTVTFAALLGYIINGQSVFEIVVPDALLFQNENGEAPCFVEPKQNEIVNGDPKCGETTFPITTTVFTLDPATGEYDNGVATVTRGDVKDVQLCDGLAFTGADSNWGMYGLLGVLLALAGALTLLIRSQHRHSAE